MDSLIVEVGEFGRFQKFSLFLLGTIAMTVAMSFYVTIFNTAEPDLNCYYNNPQLSSNDTKLATCQMWNNYTNSIKQSETSIFTCEFDKTYYTSTIINDWELVCDKLHFAGLTQTIFLIGNISGFLSGLVSDKYGRKKASIIFLVLFIVFSLIFNILMMDSLFKLNVWSRYIIYTIFQLISGVLTCCFQVTLFVHTIEFTTEDYHVIIGNVTSYLYIIGEILILIAYYISRNWIDTNWFISIFALVTLIPYVLLIPESPRWLAEVNRFDESYEALKKMAKFNNIKNFHPNKDSTIKLMQVHKSETHLKEMTDNEKVNGFFEIFDKNFNYLKLLGLFVVFNVVTYNYVSFTVGITTLLDVNPYLMFLFSSVFEMVGISICHLNNILGRRKSLLIYTLLISFCSILVALLPNDPNSEVNTMLIIKTIFTLFARIFISATYNTIMIYGAELYEVKIRNSILAFLICTGNLLSLISPQVNLLQELVWEPIPYLVYSACGFISASIIFFLPETYHINTSGNGI